MTKMSYLGVRTVRVIVGEFGEAPRGPRGYDISVIPKSQWLRGRAVLGMTFLSYPEGVGRVGPGSGGEKSDTGREWQWHYPGITGVPRPGTEKEPPAMLAAVFFVATLPFTALVLVLVLPARMLPDYRRGGWGRFARR